MDPVATEMDSGPLATFARYGEARGFGAFALLGAVFVYLEISG